MCFMSFLQFLHIWEVDKVIAQKVVWLAMLILGYFCDMYIIKIYFGKFKKILKTFGSKTYKRRQFP